MRALTPVFILILAMPHAATAGWEPSEVPAEQIRKTFAWFDTLDLPDVEKLRYVRVPYLARKHRGPEEHETRYWYGFLTEDEGARFSVLHPGGRIATYQKSPPTSDRPGVRYEPAELPVRAREFLADLRARRAERRKRSLDKHMRDDAISMRLEILTTAWFCHRCGHPELAVELAQFAGTIPDWLRGSERGWSLKRRIVHDFAERWMGVALIWIEPLSPAQWRRYRLGRVRWVVEHCRENSLHGRAVEETAILSRMVKDDEEYAKSPPNLSTLSIDEQVAGLIFQLRDQAGRQPKYPGRCDVFDDPRGPNSPAAKLVTIGLEAVPQLIEALPSKDFTRCIGAWRSYAPAYALRVGDCARAILERIAGRSFYRRTSSGGEMIKDGDASVTQRKVRDWWKQVQERGE